MTNNKEKETEADVIWEEIKNKTLDLYGLPNQTVEGHVKKLAVPGNELLLKMNASAVLPALEAAIAPKFEVEMSENYVIVRRKASDLDVNKLIEKK